MYFGKYEGPYIQLGQSQPRLKYSQEFFRRKSIDTKDFMRAEAKTGAKGKAIEDNMLVEVDAETVPDLCQGEVNAKAQNSVSYATPVVDAEECLVDGKEENGLFACLGFSVKILDLHADLLVEDLEVHDQMHVHANSSKALQTASPKIRQSGRSLQVGTVSGMIVRDTPKHGEHLQEESNNK